MNKKQQFPKIVSIILAVFIILTVFTGFSLMSAGNMLTAQSLEEELEQVKKEREETQKKIEEVKKQEAGQLKEVKEVETVLLSSLEQLNSLNDRLYEAKLAVDETTIDLVMKEQELKKIEDELTEKVNILNSRVASIYKNNNGNILEILLKAEDFIEFVSRLKLMNLLARQDADIVMEVKDKKAANLNIKKAILDLRETQEKRKAEIADLVGQAENKQREVEDIYNEKSSILSSTRANKNALIAMEKDLEIEEAEITRILESYKYGNAPGSKFMWPTPGRVRSGFGMRIHPIFGVPRFHSGIDIVASSGTLVKAADGGEVISAGYNQGYGYSVMVYHGGGFATRYAHLSRILVSVGQTVARAQVIGLVGSTGWSTGPHLHFEVRINGAAQNPYQYLE